jgi:5'-deoxynucleotidase YfbR-like HD superfamily hydrolase
MPHQLDHVSTFLLELDKLKSVNRRTFINGGERVENSAEHSWHLAIACWAFAELLKEDFDLLKLLQLALVHDLGEIDAGDTFLYGSARGSAHIKERECVQRLASFPGNAISNLVAYMGRAGGWEQQGSQASQSDRQASAVHAQHDQRRPSLAEPWHTQEPGSACASVHRERAAGNLRVVHIEAGLRSGARLAGRFMKFKGHGQ